MLEAALTMRALMTQRPDEFDTLVRQRAESFAAEPIEALFRDGEDKMPILRAARAMHALVKGPAFPFTRVVMSFYYRLVRELHSPHIPEWITGGARAGEGAATTAYVTGECVRAISAMADLLDRTAATMRAVAQVAEEWAEVENSKVPPQWLEIDARRLAYHLFTTLEPHRGNDAFRPDLPLRDNGSVVFERPLLDSALGMKTTIESSLARAKQEFADACKDVSDYRKAEFASEPEPKRKALLAPSDSAHEIALGALQRAHATAIEAEEAFRATPTLAKRLRAIADIFEKAAKRTRRVIQPAITYLSRVVDHELAAAASADNAHCDTPELAFAAASYGSATGLWHDERLRRAAVVLASRMSERGSFPFGKPLRPAGNGYKAHVIGSEVIRAFSQLLEKVTAFEVEPSIVKKMMMYFHDRAVRDEVGLWHHDDPPDPATAHQWSTAFAVVALDRINRMLDARINHKVLKQFSSRTVEGPALEDLFYPDYGLVASEAVPKRTESIAVILERMRAHIRGVPRRHDPRDAVYSVILHGPPGTGKTTLVEALARSAGVPLVEVTPSDIVMGGVDAVERRTRAVFKALSLLTRVVIMFDEFDPVLQARDPSSISPSSVFSFLTPGMLPKLKALHDAASKRSSAYVLITNLVGKLDTAAIREGRFDVPVGIYPPDVLSRAGRLQRIVESYDRQMRAPVGDVPVAAQIPIAEEGRSQRLVQAVIETAGVSMNTLGRRGWYTAPAAEARRGEDIFSMIYHKTTTLNCRRMADARRNGSGDEADREYQEWAWVEAWDRAAAELQKPTLQDLIKAAPMKMFAETAVPLDFNAAAAHCDLCRHMAAFMKVHAEMTRGDGSRPTVAPPST